MTRPDIEGLKTLAEKATPGPWHKGSGDIYADGNEASDFDDRVICGIGVAGLRSSGYSPIRSHKPEGKANAAFIAAARQAVPDLIAYIEELEARRSAPAPSVGREEIARVIYDELEGPVANQDFGRQMRQWAQCEKIADAILTLLGRGS